MPKLNIYVLFLEVVIFTLLPVFAMVGYLPVSLARLIMVILTIIIIPTSIWIIMKSPKKIRVSLIFVTAIILGWRIFIGLHFILYGFKWCPSCP